MSIHYNGKVGIGKEPVSQLDVNGIISQNAPIGLGIDTPFQALPTIWIGTARFAAGVNITKLWEKMMAVTKIGTLLHITGQLAFGFNPANTSTLASKLESTFKRSGQVPNIRGTLTIDLKDIGMDQVTDSCKVSVILNNSVLSGIASSQIRMSGNMPLGLASASIRLSASVNVPLGLDNGSQRAFTDNYVVIKDGKLHIGIDASNGNPIDSTRANYTKVDMLLSIGSPYAA
jgi:hypothetical protein